MNPKAITLNQKNYCIFNKEVGIMLQMHRQIDKHDTNWKHKT
jgi:hypothetical protein